MQKKSKNYGLQKKGFTVIETLLFVVTSATILLAVSLFLSILLQTRVKNQTIAEVEQNGMQIVQIISLALRNASSVETPSNGANGSLLSFTTPTAQKNPTVIDLSGSSLRIMEGVQSPLTLSSSRVSVSNLLFSNLSDASSPDSIRMQFTLSRLNPNNINEYDYSKTFYATASLRK